MQTHIENTPQLIRNQPGEKLTLDHILILSHWCNINQGSVNYKTQQITETIHYFLTQGKDHLVTQAFQTLQKQKSLNHSQRGFSNHSLSILINAMDFACITFPHEKQYTQLVGLPMLLWAETDTATVDTCLPDIQQITEIITNSTLLPIGSTLTLQPQLLEFNWLTQVFNNFGDSFSASKHILSGQGMPKNTTLKLTGNFACATPVLLCGHLSVGMATIEEMFSELSPFNYQHHLDVEQKIGQILQWQLSTPHGRVNAKPGSLGNIINAIQETDKLIFGLQILEELKYAYIEYGRNAKIKILLMKNKESITGIKLVYITANDTYNTEIDTGTDPVGIAHYLAQSCRNAGFSDIDIVLCDADQAWPRHIENGNLHRINTQLMPVQPGNTIH